MPLCYFQALNHLKTAASADFPLYHEVKFLRAYEANPFGQPWGDAVAPSEASNLGFGFVLCFQTAHPDTSLPFAFP